MIRITNNLFESIQKVMQGDKQPVVLNEQTKEVAEGQVDKAHYCATHVEHAIFGEGICIAEAHADPDVNGNIEWYTVQFKDGVRKVYAEAMKVKKAKMHEHVEVTDEMIDQEVADLSDEEFEETLQEALALDEASYSAKAARAGKDIGKPGKMFGKIAASAAKRYGSAERGKKVAGAVLAKLRAKNMEEGAMSDLDADRKDRAYQTRQAKTTMKHISNPTPGEKAAANDIKPGIAGYRDRIALLKSAQARGGLKAEGMDLVEKRRRGDDYKRDDSDDEDVLANREAYAKKHGTGQVYKKTYPGDKVGMSKSYAYDIKRTGPKGKLPEGMDPVGKEDEDIDNDGDKDKSDSYLHNRRKAIKAAMKEEVEIVYYVAESIKVEVPTEPTYNDYLEAARALADDTVSEKEIIAVASEAFDNKDFDIILEAAMSKAQKKDVKDKMSYYFGPEKKAKPAPTSTSSATSSSGNFSMKKTSTGTVYQRKLKDNEGQGTTQAERRTMKRIASRSK